MSFLSTPLRVGDWVEVRSSAEILATLDADGRYNRMPFMPEMLDFCGQRFQVQKIAHKTCDTVYPLRSRRVIDSVHLPTRCDGQSHGGCQAHCLLFWKTAWLKKVPGPAERVNSTDRQAADIVGESTRMLDVDGLVRRQFDGNRYECQATALPAATDPLSVWDPRQYFLDVVSGNAPLKSVLNRFFFAGYYWLSQLGIGLGRPMRALYERISHVRGGPGFPRNAGEIPLDQPTPIATLGLLPGEYVRVKPFAEILKTLNTDNRNRGMRWDAEMVPYCGKVFRVLDTVSRIVDEKSGRLMEMKTPAVILDGAVCGGRYSTWCLNCPRAIYPYWREIWLERVRPEDVPAALARR